MNLPDVSRGFLAPFTGNRELAKVSQKIDDIVEETKQIMDGEADMMEHGWVRLVEADNMRRVLAGDNAGLHKIMAEDEMIMAVNFRRYRDRAFRGYRR